LRIEILYMAGVKFYLKKIERGVNARGFGFGNKI